MDNDDLFPKVPNGGNGRLRALLKQIQEDENEMLNNPLYKEGYDDGYQQGLFEAGENAKEIIRRLVKLYN